MFINSPGFKSPPTDSCDISGMPQAKACSGVFRIPCFRLPQFLHDVPVSLSTYSENNLGYSKSFPVRNTVTVHLSVIYTVGCQINFTLRLIAPILRTLLRIVHVQSSRSCLFSAPPQASLKSSPKLPVPIAHGHSARPKSSSGLPVA